MRRAVLVASRVWPSVLVALLAFEATGAIVHRGYEALVGLGSSDPNGVGDAARAAHEVAEVGRSLRVTAAARRAYALATTVLRSVDFGSGLSSPMALPLPDGTRAFALSGRRTGAGYVLDYERATVDAIAPEQFLDFGADLRILEERDPVPDRARGFGVAVNLKAHAGELSHRSLARFVTGSLRVLDPENLARLPASRAPVFTATSPLDVPATQELYATLPATSALLDRFVDFAPGLRAAAHGGVPYAQAKTVLKPRLSVLEHDYPALGAFVRRFLEDFRLTARAQYRLLSGSTVGEMALSSERQELTITYATRGGALIPRDASGVPRFDQAIDLTRLEAHEGEVVFEFACEVLGLSVRGSNIVFGTSFSEGPFAELTARLQQLPVPEVGGWALGIAPDWAIDLFIPGSLAGYAEEIALGLRRGQRSQGTFVRLSVDTRRPSATQLRGDASTELIDNFFINFWMRVVLDYLWPSPAVIDEGWALFLRSARALDGDLAVLQRRAALPTAAATTVPAAATPPAAIPRATTRAEPR